MALLYSPEYEKRVEYQLIQPDPNRLATPTDISTDDTTVLFSKVDNAESYSFFLDGVEIGSANLPGDGYLHYLFNELIDIDDDTNTTYSISFDCNDTSYNSLKVYGRNQAPDNTGKFAIYYDNTKVFEEKEDGSSSLWESQDYRLIIIKDTPASALLEFLSSAAVAQPEQLYFDLSTLQSWTEIEDGDHVLQIVARAQNKVSSFLSAKIYFSKNAGFIKGHLYGPFSITRVVDGDTVVANIKGADMKIRMIGVNTPESVSSMHPEKNCPEGKEASNYTKSQLSGQQIYIEFDDGQYDDFNRYLCYIYRENQKSMNKMYNAELVRLGYAEAEAYPPNVTYESNFNDIQAEAEASRVGFWGTDFFPTTIVPPVISLDGSVVTWKWQPHMVSYTIKIKKSGRIVHSEVYTQVAEATQNSYDVAAAIAEHELGTGNFVINVTNTEKTDGAHNIIKKVSNEVTYTVS